MTPEYLRLGLPLDQSRHDEGRKILLTERKKEYNDMLAKVIELGVRAVLLYIVLWLVDCLSSLHC